MTVTTDLLSIEPVVSGLRPEALEYLQKTISEKDRSGVMSFVIAQSSVFNQHACHLAAVLTAVQNAPGKLNLHSFELQFIEWLRSHGVSSSRITQLKGAIRVKTRAVAENSFYSYAEQQMIQNLEVEKAYIFGRLNWDGQKSAFDLYQDQGNSITLKDLRELIKEYVYDPSVKWSENWSPSTTDRPSSEETAPKTPISMKAYDLAQILQGVVDELLDIHHLWADDPRVKEVVDAQRLTEVSQGFCAGRLLREPYEF